MEPPPAEVRPAIDYSRLLDCLQMVEGHQWTDKGGALGFTPGAWDEDSYGLPFVYAKNRNVARVVACRRLLRVGRLLAQHKISPTVRNLAQVWRSGLSGVVGGEPVQPDYGERVSNLYHDATTPDLTKYLKP